jgi:hypothetical protein
MPRSSAPTELGVDELLGLEAVDPRSDGHALGHPQRVRGPGSSLIAREDL